MKRYRNVSTVDTRSKIVDCIDPFPDGCLHVARGWFSVLTADQCRLLEQSKPANARLAVLVYQETDLRPTPLPSHDRAQLIAALGCVDQVCVCHEADAPEIISQLRPAAEVDADAALGRDVVSDVLERHAEP